jgi:hypothetical protein
MATALYIRGVQERPWRLSRTYLYGINLTLLK